MPRSVLLGRVVGPGEPLFTDEDTAYAMALAEEEAATCPSCGMLKVVCRDANYQFAFEPHEEQCHVTKRLAEHRASAAWAAKAETTQQSTQVSARFRDGYEAPFDVGLGLDVEVDELPVIPGVADLAAE